MISIEYIVYLKRMFKCRMVSLIRTYKKAAQDIKEKCGQEVDQINIDLGKGYTVGLFFDEEKDGGWMFYVNQCDIPHDMDVKKHWSVKMETLIELIDLLKIPTEKVVEACLQQLEK